MQDLNNLAKLIAARKGLSIEEATAKVQGLIKGKTDFGAKLAINHYLETEERKTGQTTLKGYHDTHPHERIKE